MICAGTLQRERIDDQRFDKAEEEDTTLEGAELNRIKEPVPLLSLRQELYSAEDDEALAKQLGWQLPLAKQLEKQLQRMGGSKVLNSEVRMNAFTELKQLKQAPHLVKTVCDAVLILLSKELVPMKAVEG